MPKVRWDQYLSFVFICLGLVLSQVGLVSESSAVVASLLMPQSVVAAPVPVFVAPDGPLEIEALTLSQYQDQFVASVSARAIYVIDMPSASILLEKNSQQLYSPASTTKLLTALVTRELYRLDQELEVTDEASTAGTVVGLTPGEKLPVRDLLSAMLIQSGNDAAMVVANHHPGGYSGFIASMNQKAKAIGLSQSQFTNPSGLDEERHQMTARDVATLAREVMKDQLLAEIVGTQTEIIQNTTQPISHQLFNTNALLTANLGVVGIKTGTTELAGEVLVTEVKNNGRDLVIVVMGSEDRYEDTKKILNWISSHYIWVDPNSGTLPMSK